MTLSFLLGSRVLIAYVLIAFSAEGVAQRQLFRIPTYDDALSVSGAGDIDGDGHAEVLVGDPFFTTREPDTPGCYYLVRGRDGKVTPDCGACCFDYVGWSVSGGGDMNGDGVPDLAFGAPGFASASGLVEVLSGKDRKRLLQRLGDFDDFLGKAVSIVGDMNRDGRADVVFGAPVRNRHGYAEAWSLAAGRLRRFDGDATFSGVGEFVAAAGDVNNDGHADVILAAENSERVRVYSSKDGKSLHEVRGTGGDGVGDLNKDGFDDYVLWETGGQVVAYSGKDRAKLLNWPGVAGRGAGDVDRDGRPDVLVRSAQGAVGVFSGDGGKRLFLLPGTWISMDGAGDVNADGTPDLVLGGSGVATVFSGRPLALWTDVHELSLSKGGTQRFHLTYPKHHNEPVWYIVLGSVSGTMPGRRIGNVTLPLNWDAYTMMTECLANTFIANSVGVFDAAGKATAQLQFPKGLSPSLEGVLLHHAFLAFWPEIDFASNPAPLTLVK